MVQIQCVSSLTSLYIMCDASALQDMYDDDDDCLSSMMPVYI